jgi:hypothetical protein
VVRFLAAISFTFGLMVLLFLGSSQAGAQPKERDYPYEVFHGDPAKLARLDTKRP